MDAFRVKIQNWKVSGKVRTLQPTPSPWLMTIPKLRVLVYLGVVYSGVPCLSDPFHLPTITPNPPQSSNHRQQSSTKPQIPTDSKPSILISFWLTPRHFVTRHGPILWQLFLNKVKYSDSQLTWSHAIGATWPMSHGVSDYTHFFL